MMRTWAGWYAAALAAHCQHGAPRPLLIVLDCKGGPDARTKAARTRTLLHGAGAGRVAIWPDEATVSLWGLPPAELAVTLFQLIETETVGAAAYYADVTQAVITLAVTAPPGPPADGAAFLDRLEPGWLEAAYAGDASRLGAVTAAPAQPGRCQPALPDPAFAAWPWPGRTWHPGRRRRRDPAVRHRRADRRRWRQRHHRARAPGQARGGRVVPVADQGESMARPA